MEEVSQASWVCFVYSKYLCTGNKEKFDFRNLLVFSLGKKKQLTFLKDASSGLVYSMPFKAKHSLEDQVPV